ncbi:MAG: CPBP family intramembrane glutamic endopeptidase [Erysipelotrichaceae bacterium]
MKKQTKGIVFYLLLVVALLIYPMYVVVFNGGINGPSGSMMVLIIMWIPAVAAVVTKLILERSLRGLGFIPHKNQYLLVSYIIPLIGCLIVYGICWGLQIGILNVELLQYMSIPTLLGVPGVLLSLLTAVGEEIGWRGYLVPKLLETNSFNKTVLISGIIWNLYHYPLIFFGGYNSGVNIGFAIVMFTISIFCVCTITAYLRFKTNSFWAPALFHASHNYFVQSVFDMLTTDVGATKYFTTEFGLGLMMFYLVVALIIINKMKKSKA